MEEMRPVPEMILFYFEEWGGGIHKILGGCQRKKDGVLKQTQENHNKYLLLTPSSPQIDL